VNLTRIAGASGKKEPAAKSVGALESWEPRSLTAVRVLSLGLAIDWGGNAGVGLCVLNAVCGMHSAVCGLRSDVCFASSILLPLCVQVASAERRREIGCSTRMGWVAKCAGANGKLRYLVKPCCR
jgi:hypothetical protein